MKYNILVRETYTRDLGYEVEADSEEEARKKAADMSGEVKMLDPTLAFESIEVFTTDESGEIDWESGKGYEE